MGNWFVAIGSTSIGVWRKASSQHVLPPAVMARSHAVINSARSRTSRAYRTCGKAGIPF